MIRNRFSFTPALKGEKICSYDPWAQKNSGTAPFRDGVK